MIWLWVSSRLSELNGGSPLEQLVQEDPQRPPVAFWPVAGVALLSLQHLGRNIVAGANRDVGGDLRLNETQGGMPYLPVGVQLDARPKIC